MAATVSLIQSLYQGTQTGNPVPWAAGMGTVILTGLMSATDATDPSKGGNFWLEISFDGGQSYSRGSGRIGGWAGATLPNGQPNYPTARTPYPAGAQPTHVRAVGETQAPLSYGLAVDFSA